MKKSEVNGEGDGDATGTEEYERCLQFAEMLKTLGVKDAKMLRWVINEKAKEFGLLSGYTKLKAGLAYEEPEAAEGAMAYKLDMDDFNELKVQILIILSSEFNTATIILTQTCVMIKYSDLGLCSRRCVRLSWECRRHEMSRRAFSLTQDVATQDMSATYRQHYDKKNVITQ